MSHGKYTRRFRENRPERGAFTETITILLQLIIALGILNVWIPGFGKSSEWRGGGASNMKEEFAVDGLPPVFLYLAGFLKLVFAGLLISGIWIPELVRPTALGMSILMLGAIGMHLKVRDPLKKSLPAITLLVLSVMVMA